MSLINDALKRAKQAQSQRPADKPIGVSLEPVSARSMRSIPVWLIPVAVVFCLIVASALMYYGWRVSKSSQQTASAPRAPLLANNTLPAPVAASPVVPNPSPVVAIPAPAPPQTPVSTIQSKLASAARQRIQVDTNLVTRTTVVQTVQAPAESLAPAVPVAKPPAPIVSEKKPSPVPKAAEDAALETAAAAPPVISPPVRPAAPVSLEPAEWPAMKLQGIFFRLSRPSASINGKTIFVGDSVEGVKVLRIERQSVVLELKGQHKTLYLP